MIFILIGVVCAKTTNLSGNLTTSGTLSCESLGASSMTLETLNASLDVSSSSVYSNTTQVSTLTFESLEPIGDYIYIKADLVIEEPSSSSFTELNWKLKEHHSFQEDHHAWSLPQRTNCSNEVFLGGHCKTAQKEVTRKFWLPKHKWVRVTALYHMLGKWNGESGYMKLNGKLVWAQTGTHTEGVDVCGVGSSDTKFAVPVDSTIPNSGNTIEVTFGSTLKADPCEASFGIDDIMIYTR